MPLTIEGLRRAFPVITEDAYPSDRVEYWLEEALLSSGIRQCIWGTRYTRGMYAWVAHKLIIEKMMLDVNEDGLGGYEASRGAITSESDSVDGVKHAVTYAAPDSSSACSTGENWSETRPGREYEDMARIVGMSRGAAYVE